MGAPTDAGRMTARLRFDEWAVTGTDEGGGEVRGWVPRFFRWAEVRPLKGGEQVQAQRLAGKQPVLVFVRFDPQTSAVTPSWRVVEVVTAEVDDVETTASEICTYAIKTACDMERDRAFITLQAVSGDADS